MGGAQGIFSRSIASFIASLLLQVRPKRPRAKPGTVPAAGSQVAAAGGGLLPGGDGDDDVILSQLASQPLSQMLSQPITSQPLSQSQAAGRGESGWCMELSTQAGCSTEGEEEPPPVPMEVGAQCALLVFFAWPASWVVAETCMEAVHG